MHSIHRTETSYNKGRFFGVEVVESKQTINYELTIVDVFGTPLERDQKILYARESYGSTTIHKGKILGIGTDGTICLEWGETPQVVNISKHDEILNPNRTGEARYNNIYVLPENEKDTSTRF